MTKRIYSRRAGRELIEQRKRERLLKSHRESELIKKSWHLLSHYKKQVNPAPFPNIIKHVEAFKIVQARGFTDLQICLKIAEYKEQLAGSPGMSPVQFCKKLVRDDDVST